MCIIYFLRFYGGLVDLVLGWWFCIVLLVLGYYWFGVNGVDLVSFVMIACWRCE